MPTIFDNIERRLLPALRGTLENADRAAFCVGYFHIRGWDSLADLVEKFDGSDASSCRVLVGMNKADEELETAYQQSIYLSRFYGSIIPALACFSDLELEVTLE